jgi:hypothetical protein
MVALQSSDSSGDRPPGHQGSRHEARIPAMVSSSDLPSAYDPFASAQQANTTLPMPPNIASRRGGGQVSSNIGSFQSIDQPLLAGYMRQAQEVSRVFSLFQHEMRTHIQQSPVAPPSTPTTTWIPTPNHHVGPPQHVGPLQHSDLIDFGSGPSHQSTGPSPHHSTGSSQHLGYPFSPPVAPVIRHFAARPLYPSQADTSGFPGSISSIEGLSTIHYPWPTWRQYRREHRGSHEYLHLSSTIVGDGVILFNALSHNAPRHHCFTIIGVPSHSRRRD